MRRGSSEYIVWVRRVGVTNIVSAHQKTSNSRIEYLSLLIFYREYFGVSSRVHTANNRVYQQVIT